MQAQTGITVDVLGLGYLRSEELADDRHNSNENVRTSGPTLIASMSQS